MPATTISVEGDKAFVTNLKKLAALREQTVSKIVRAALDQVYGSDLQRIESASFFVNGDASTHQNTDDASS